VAQTQSSQIQDVGGRHLEKSKNRHISATVLLITAKFGTVTHIGTLTHIFPTGN